MLYPQLMNKDNNHSKYSLARSMYTKPDITGYMQIVQTQQIKQPDHKF